MSEKQKRKAPPASSLADQFYGTGYEGFVTPGRTAAQMQPQEHQLLPTATQFFKALSDPKQAQRTLFFVGPDAAETNLKNAELTRRSAISGLGFDPRMIAYMPEGVSYGNAAGRYDAGSDLILADQDKEDPTTATHESIHRGLAQMYKAEVPLSRGIDEELLVRRMMQTVMGDPEKNVPADQRNIPNAEAYDAEIARLEPLAARLFAARRPFGGPR